MKRSILFLLLASQLFAQEEVEVTPALENPVVIEEAPPLPPHAPKKGDNTQNWLFAAGSLVAATAAIVFVLWNPGHTPPNPTP